MSCLKWILVDHTNHITIKGGKDDANNYEQEILVLLLKMPVASKEESYIKTQSDGDNESSMR